MTVRWLMAATLVAAAAVPAAGQAREAVTDAFRGSVPQGTASAEPLALSFKETLDRGLQFNLGLLLQEETQRAAHGARWTALADLLPNLKGSVSERRQVINLEAFGFPAPDPIVGPFNVFDARIGLSQRLIDLAALNEARAASLDEKVQLSGIRSARELVVLVTVNLYLEAISASSRIDVARAQLETANVLQRQASNLKTSGLVAGIDVLRAEAQVQRQRQRLIVAENDFEKAKLRLGRSIGLPPGQRILLTDTIPFAPLDAIPLEQAIQNAYVHRADYLAAADRVAAAEARAKAASAERLPSLSLDADYGTIGQTVSNAHPTYTVAATLRVPIFEGGRVKGRTIEADAELRQQRAVYDDLRARIDTEVRSAFLDVNAAAQQVDTAQTTVGLATQELAQARDRFAAGVSDTIEVTRAQESLARASEDRIDALYQHNVAKAVLARAVGIAEEAVLAFASGVK
ncbi:MAG TPA: TolC family protein [Vicinamibacterales bacterium]|nr:TolC family protein [Vicinamibacterales bacterium]